MASRPVQLPSGKWRVWVQYSLKNGKTVRKTFTADTKAEVAYKAAEFELNKDEPQNLKMTVGQAARKYIEMSEPILAPTTIAGYEKILRDYFKEFQLLDIDALSDQVCQTYINREIKRPSKRGGTLSPKTVNNAWGFISSALHTVCDLQFRIRLPKNMPKSIILPEPSVVVKAVKGSSVELPCLLAIWCSFSMSEIRGLKCSDLKRNVLTINRVKVDIDGYPYVKENAKVASRLRSQEMPPYLLKMIKRTPAYERYEETGIDDFIIDMNSTQIRRKFQQLIRSAGYDMTFHQLRHLNASVMLALGVPDKYAMERGGWSTPYVMQNVYQHTFTDTRKAVDRKINNYFESLIK